MGIKATRQGVDGDDGDTHVKYCQVHSTDVNGDLTVTFPGGVFSLPPVVTATVVSDASGNQYFAELVGSTTNTTAVIKVRKLVGLSLNILSLGLINLFTSPGVCEVHVIASEAP